MRILPILLAGSLLSCTAALGGPPEGGAEAADPAARLTYAGRVVDEEGRPVAGAVVFADDGAPYQVIQEWTEIPWRRVVLDPLAAADVGPGTLRGREPSGPVGSFRVDGVRAPAGRAWILATAGDRVPGRKEAKDLAAVRG